MKIFYAAVLLFLFSNQSMAYEYICNSDKTNEQAMLTISENSPQPDIHWSEVHSASSKGVFIGLEDAPHSSFLGYVVYSLTDFYNTEDSDFRLAIEPNSDTDIFYVYSYFNNDDHNEEETKYTCYLKENL